LKIIGWVEKLPEIENSEIVRYVLQKVIDISSRKTTQGHAVTTMNNSLKKLEEKYNFLKHVEIKDTRYIEMLDPISVMSDIDNVQINDVGKALYDIIKTINSSLGKNAGYFFIKELKNTIDEDVYTVLEEMGLDLGIMQLESEVEEMTRKL